MTKPAANSLLNGATVLTNRSNCSLSCAKSARRLPFCALTDAPARRSRTTLARCSASWYLNWRSSSSCRRSVSRCRSAAAAQATDTAALTLPAASTSFSAVSRARHASHFSSARWRSVSAARSNCLTTHCKISTPPTIIRA